MRSPPPSAISGRYLRSRESSSGVGVSARRTRHSPIGKTLSRCRFRLVFSLGIADWYSTLWLIDTAT